MPTRFCLSAPMVIAFLAFASLHKAYTKPTRCLHDAYIINVKINGNVNSSTSTLISTGTKEAVGVLAEIVWPVCKMLPY